MVVLYSHHANKAVPLMHANQQNPAHMCLHPMAGCVVLMTSCIAVSRNLLREELLVAPMFGDSHSEGAVASAPELGLGGQQVGGLQGVSLQPLLQLLLHIARIPPVTPAPTLLI